MEAYVYTPLSTKDSIRVLSLLPGQPGDALRARLTEVQLSKQPVFSALSYCWGEPKFDLILECDAKWLKITKSLAAALNSLRDRTQPLPIWVDQVCIHQQDISERNTQVTLMGKIYSNASTVYLWLGE
ncbi:heterokaryon incompatibility protein-domain-containing protein, partial [Pyrenochaeta sp. MPI-SDFR-AT-0127]